jgi:putative flippase GtrA
VSYLRAVSARVRKAGPELSKFGSIGAIAFVVNILATNAMWHAMPSKRIIGSIVGTAVAIVVTYIGNRFWTYKDRDSIGRHREMALFVIVNLIGMLFESLPLAVAQYIVHWDTTLEANVAKYIIGTPLGMVFRLWTYRTWIFPPAQPALADAEFQFETGAPVRGAGAHAGSSEPLPTSELPATEGRHRRSGSGELLNTRW